MKPAESHHSNIKTKVSTKQKLTTACLKSTIKTQGQLQVCCYSFFIVDFEVFSQTFLTLALYVATEVGQIFDYCVLLHF